MNLFALLLSALSLLSHLSAADLPDTKPLSSCFVHLRRFMERNDEAAITNILNPYRKTVNPTCFEAKDEIRKCAAEFSDWALRNGFKDLFRKCLDYASAEDKIKIDVSAAVAGKPEFMSTGAGAKPALRLKALVATVPTPHFWITVEKLIVLELKFTPEEHEALLEASVQSKNYDVAFVVLCNYDFFVKAQNIAGIEQLFPDFYSWSFAELAEEAMKRSSHPMTLSFILMRSHQHIDFATCPGLGKAILTVHQPGNAHFPGVRFSTHGFRCNVFGKILRDLKFTVEDFKALQAYFPKHWWVDTAMESGIEEIIEYLAGDHGNIREYLKNMLPSIPFALSLERYRNDFNNLVHYFTDSWMPVVEQVAFVGTSADLESPLGQTIHMALFICCPLTFQKLPVKVDFLSKMNHRSSRVLLMTYVAAHYEVLFKELSEKPVPEGLKFLLDPAGHEYMEEFSAAKGDTKIFREMLLANRKEDAAVNFALAFVCPESQERSIKLLHALVLHGLPDLHTAHFLLSKISAQPQENPEFASDLFTIIRKAAENKHSALLKIAVLNFNLEPSLLLQLPVLQPFRAEIGAVVGTNYDLDKALIWQDSLILVKLAAIICEGDMEAVNRILPYMGEMDLLQLIYVFTPRK